MAARDRTALFMGMRAGDDPDPESLLPARGVKMVPTNPAWATQYREVQDRVALIGARLDALDRAQRAQRARPGLGGEVDARLEETAAAIMRDLERAQADARALGAHVEAAPTHEQRRACAGAQRECTRLVRDLAQRAHALRAAHAAALRRRDVLGEIAGIGQAPACVQITEQLAASDVDIAERSAAIAAIERSMRELFALFQQLDQEVIVQGSLLDQIDQNVQSAAGHIKRAADELAAADKSDRAHAARCGCLALLVAVLVALLIALIVRSA